VNDRMDALIVAAVRQGWSVRQTRTGTCPTPGGRPQGGLRAIPDTTPPRQEDP